MTGQFGGNKIGGPSLANSTMVPQDFRSFPSGSVRDVFITINMSVRNNANATTQLSISTGSSAASEGTDDLDLIANAVFTNLTMLWDTETQAFSLTPAQLRTVLGLFNIRDFTGAIFGLTAANSVPASASSAKATSLVIDVPVSLKKYFEDGDIYKNGSLRLADGQLQYTGGANITGTTAVVCANATINVTAVSLNVYILLGAGSEGDVGHVWKVERKASVQTVYKFDPRLRIALLDVSPAASNAVSSYNVGPYGLIDPTTLAAKYQMDKLPANSGFDITFRCTPLLYLDNNRKFADLAAMLGSITGIEAVSGVTSLTLYDITDIPPTPQAVASVSQIVGAGGGVSVSYPTPSSLPPGTAVSGALQSHLPQRIQPGSAGGVMVPNAASAGLRQANGLQKTHAFGQTIRSRQGK